jgi:Ca2+-binding EF-hand superfamily protein
MIETLVKIAEKDKLAKVFKEMDTNNDGKLSKDELVEGIIYISQIKDRLYEDKKRYQTLM